METKIYFLLFFLFLFWAYCLYWPLKAQRKVETPVEFFIYGRQMPSWVFAIVSTGTIFSGWFFVAHPGLIFANGLPFSMTTLSVITIPMIGALVMKRQWMLSKRFGFVTPSEMLASYFKSEIIRILVVITAILFAIPFLALQLSLAGKLIGIVSNGVIGEGSGALLRGTVIIIYIGLMGIKSTAYIDTFLFFFFIFGIISIGFITYDLVGGWDMLNESLSRVSGLKEKMYNISSDYTSYLSLSGTINKSSLADKSLFYPGEWTTTMVMSFSFGLTGILLSPNFSMLTFSSKNLDSFASQQSWFSGLLMGFVLIFFSLAIGVGSVLLGANEVVNNSGNNISNILPEKIFPQNIDTIIPHILNLIGEYSPVFFSILVLCAMAAFQATGNFYLSTSALITRDIVKRFFFQNMKGGQQIFVSRIIVMFIFFIALSLALSTSDNILGLGSFSLSIGCQMLIPLIAICYFPWFTKNGISLGLIVGLVVVFLTEQIGQSLMADILPWGKWPFTIHSSAWGVIFNLISASVISFITQDIKEKNHKHKFHEFINDYKAISSFRRSLKPSAWIVVAAWLFFGIGPGSILGNNFFGNPKSVESWSFGMPSLWVWQIIFWIIGIFIVWFISSKMEMSTTPKKNIVSYSEDIAKN